MSMTNTKAFIIIILKMFDKIYLIQFQYWPHLFFLQITKLRLRYPNLAFKLHTLVHKSLHNSFRTSNEFFNNIITDGHVLRSFPVCLPFRPLI